MFSPKDDEPPGGELIKPKTIPFPTFESGKQMSMGALVESTGCSICTCDALAEPHTHGMSVEPGRDPWFRFLYVSVDPPPKCEVCKNGMLRLDNTNWTCRTGGCANLNVMIPAHLSGIYPVQDHK